jgi:hypothetical protein
VERLSYALHSSRRIVTVGLSESETLPLLASPSRLLFPERLFPERLALFRFDQIAAASSPAAFASDSAPSSAFHP